MKNPAKNEHPVLDPIKHRWSPRAYEDKPVEVAKLRSMFEAARWAASAFNEQPWRFIVATKDDPAAYEKALGCLVEANQAWAKAAPVLVLTVVSHNFAYNGSANRVALHDLGQAAAHLALEATNQGLIIHQMAGIDQDKIKAAYNLPEGFTAETGIAIGYAGTPDDLPEGKLREMETAERKRNAFDDFVFGDDWGKASGLF